jgi:hypothetical protein
MKHRIIKMVVCLMAFSLTAYTQSEPPIPRFQEQRIGSMPSEVIDGAISSDGCHLAIVVEHQGKWHLEIDGQPGPEYDEVSTPIFSPDGRRGRWPAGIGV